MGRRSTMPLPTDDEIRAAVAAADEAGIERKGIFLRFGVSKSYFQKRLRMMGMAADRSQEHEALLAQAVVLLKAGKTRNEIQAETGWCRAAVYKLDIEAQERGLVEKKGWTPNYERVLELRKAGKKRGEIAAETGLTIQQVKESIREISEKGLLDSPFDSIVRAAKKLDGSDASDLNAKVGLLLSKVPANAISVETFHQANRISRKLMRKLLGEMAA